MKQVRFDELLLSDEILQAVNEMGFEEASPIQSAAIPFLMDGRDVIGQAQTGTGKTAAFGIPAIESIDIDLNSPQVLVLCPTRELALQVSNEVHKLAKFKRGLRSLAVYGGESMDKQIRGFKKGAHIVVGTPGRVIDHIKRGTFRINNLQMIVLDEADEMLDMGFRDDIELVLDRMPESRQTVFFSATMPKQIMNLTKKYQVEPEIVKVVKKELTVDRIEQTYYEVRPGDKVEAMSRLIRVHDLQLMLAFCNTKRRVDEVAEKLQQQGFQAEGLHGDLSQAQRNRVMSKFRNGTINILVATDVAARGIDVNGVDAVFNYDLPQDTDFYVHRIGRTGRAGSYGKAFSFVYGKDKIKLREIERYTKSKLEKKMIPAGQELFEMKKNSFLEKLREEVSSDSKSRFDLEQMTEELMAQGLDEKSLISALIGMQLGAADNLQDINLKEGQGGGRRERTGARGQRGDRFERSGRRGGDRFNRGERGPRDRFKKKREGKADKSPRLKDKNMARLFVNMGHKSQIDKRDLLNAFSGEAGLGSREIGDVEVYSNFSFVEVPKHEADKVVQKMNKYPVKGQSMNVEFAKDPA